ncbi:hypothetical protein E4U42_002748 [Claviceps africana]|uniref:Uncharacterized protein n=1 Tax=Claviceps africana TaxID=83212 RepID=A0A8K0J860_9HYPO|nr:hypothetical protein E4U42_002748 [Claviceps africana]
MDVDGVPHEGVRDVPGDLFQKPWRGTHIYVSRTVFTIQDKNRVEEKEKEKEREKEKNERENKRQTETFVMVRTPQDGETVQDSSSQEQIGEGWK